MFVLDTGTLTHLLHGHQQVVEQVARFAEQVAITDASRIEQLRGRFDAVRELGRLRRGRGCP